VKTYAVVFSVALTASVPLCVLVIAAPLGSVTRRSLQGDTSDKCIACEARIKLCVEPESPIAIT